MPVVIQELRGEWSDADRQIHVLSFTRALNRIVPERIEPVALVLCDSRSSMRAKMAMGRRHGSQAACSSVSEMAWMLLTSVIGNASRKAARDLPHQLHELIEPMNLPSLKFLKTFQVAAKLQSFKAAAKELFVTPSAISHQIKALEEQLGVALFERGVRKLTLTDAGTHYLEHVDDMIAKLESITERLRARYGRSIIRLHVPSFFANELLLPRLASFSRAREGTDICIETTFPAPNAHSPEADLSIVVGTGPWEGLTAHELFSQSFIAACSPEFLLDNPIDTYADLNGKTLLQHEERPDAWERWALGLGISPIKPNRLIRLDNMSAVVLAAEQGVGVALVASRLSADRFVAGGLVKLFEAELTTNESYVLLHRTKDQAREELQEFTQWILSEFRVA